MKRNQNFDHNHSQKVLSCRYNMDTTGWKPGSGWHYLPSTASSLRTNMATPRHSEQNWTGYLYNKPLEYTQLVLSGEIEHYLSLGCDHGRLED